MQERGRAEVTGARRARRQLIAAGLLVAVIDQASKAWAVAALSGGRRIPLIGRALDLELVNNPGSAFGLFTGLTIVVFAVSAAILVFVTAWAWRLGTHGVAFGLVIGGGFGNIIDRLIRPPSVGRGHVVDFIDLSFWPTFNLADAAIVTGVLILIFFGPKAASKP